MSLMTSEKLEFIDRAIVPGQNWSIGVPEGFVFSTDPNVNGKSSSNPSGVYDLILLKPYSNKKGDFQSPYNNPISFVTLNYMNSSEMQFELGVTKDYEYVIEDENLSVIMAPFLTTSSSESYFVFVLSQMRFRKCQLVISGVYSKTEKREFIHQLLKSIQLHESTKGRNNMSNNQEKGLVDNAFYIGVPSGYQSSDNADKQFFCVEAGRPYYFVMNKGQRESEVPDIMYQSEEFLGIHQKIEHELFNNCSDDFSMVSGLPTNIITNTKTLSVRYESPTINDDFASFVFCVIVPGALYGGVFRINNGGHTVEEMDTIAKTILSTISPC